MASKSKKVVDFGGVGNDDQGPTLPQRSPVTASPAVEMTKTSVILPADLHMKIKMQSVRTKTSFNKLITEALENAYGKVET